MTLVSISYYYFPVSVQPYIYMHVQRISYQTESKLVGVSISYSIPARIYRGWKAPCKLEVEVHLSGGWLEFYYVCSFYHQTVIFCFRGPLHLKWL